MLRIVPKRDKGYSSAEVILENDISLLKQEVKDTKKKHCEELSLLKRELNDFKSINGAGMENILTEVHERAIRSNNLMLFNVEESKSESLEAKIADDKKIAIQVLESIGVESNDLTKVIRIGRQGNKPRPIKMILSNSNAVGYALRLKNRLLNTKFRIASDKTKLQQEQMKKVQDELKQRRDRVVNVTTPVSVSPPEKFLFSSPGTWTTWRKRFERYMLVSGQMSKPEEEKINILVYIMGEESEEIMLQFPVQPTSYKDALDSFEKYFIPRRNIIYERFKFHSTIQKPGEPIESFIKNLHSVAEHCNYGTLKEEFIRDRIVVGMLDTKTSERLQLKEQLDLKECILIVKQAELQASQNKELYNTSRLVNRVQYSSQSPRSEGSLRPRSEGSQRPRSEGSQRGRMNVGTGDKCGFCGLRSHPRDQCPAGKSKCRKCEKSGHWAVYRSSKVRSIQTRADITVFLKKFDVSFLNQLQVSDKIVTGPSGVKLKVLGTLPVKLSFQTHHFDTDIYIVEKLTKPILGRAAIVKLNVLQYINQICPIQSQDLVDTLKDNVMRKFPRIFKDVGTFKTEMHIKLVEGAQPFVQSVPRVVPIPLLKPLEEELERLQKLDIIEPIDTPTEWVK
ncbi:hypothetical protein JTB14_008890 [Gonioctena quinquepunctata]|nr:hypothetical protein JTB14_008890 [Gonioctena quinquepunctata]